MNPEQVPDAMAQWQLSRLRRLSPRPFGLMQETASSLPVALGSASWEAGIAGAVRAAVTRAPVPPASLSLKFGSLFDVAAPLVEVTTRWDGESWNDPDVPGHQPGAWELGAAEHRDGSPASSLRRKPRRLPPSRAALPVHGVSATHAATRASKCVSSKRA